MNEIELEIRDIAEKTYPKRRLRVHFSEVEGYVTIFEDSWDHQYDTQLLLVTAPPDDYDFNKLLAATKIALRVLR